MCSSQLDLTRALDSASWAYFFEILKGMGFGVLFLKWFMIILSLASSRVIVNGFP
jgi:hypothetical protein